MINEGAGTDIYPFAHAHVRMTISSPTIPNETYSSHSILKHAFYLSQIQSPALSVIDLHFPMRAIRFQLACMNNIHRYTLTRSRYRQRNIVLPQQRHDVLGTHDVRTGSQVCLANSGKKIRLEPCGLQWPISNSAIPKHETHPRKTHPRTTPLAHLTLNHLSRAYTKQRHRATRALFSHLWPRRVHESF